MNINKQNIQSSAIKLTVEENGKIIGRAYLFLIANGFHDKPYGLMEDIFVEEEYRGKGIGTGLIKALIQEAKARNCYKLIGTCRTSKVNVHAMYEGLGFEKFGIEFRMNL